ncbi:MAG: hypothetical protein AABX69_01515, partial [Nanoarchaeota archaeon]
YKAAVGDAGVGTADATLKFGGGTFRLWNSSLDTSSNFNIKFDLDGDDTLESPVSTLNAPDTRNIINITTNGGAQILLEFNPKNATNVTKPTELLTVDESVGGSTLLPSIIFSLQTLDADDYDNIAPSNIEFNLSATTAKVDIAEHTATANLRYVTPSADTNARQLYTSLGTYVNWKTVSNDPDSLEITYPHNTQALPIVTVVAPGAEVTKTVGAEAGQIVYYETTPIEVGSSKLASEVADIMAQNAIVVGGPCANAAAATLMGNPANCAEGFTEGKAMVKLVEQTNGKVALLVAGASAMDTRRAARVLADYMKWQEKGVLKGMEVEVAGTSFTDITVSAPVPKVVAPPPVVEAPAPPATP